MLQVIKLISQVIADFADGEIGQQVRAAAPCLVLFQPGVPGLQPLTLPPRLCRHGTLTPR